MHHLILVREYDQMSGCCCGSEGLATLSPSPMCISSERVARMDRLGQLYRAVKETFGHAVEITIIDPRNWVSFLPLVLRDAMRYHVAPRAALRALASASFSTGVFDGEVLFTGTIPDLESVLDAIEARLAIEELIQQTA